MRPDFDPLLPGPDLALPASQTLAMLSRDSGATLAMVNLQLQVIYANDEYARWFHTTPEQVVGKTLVELYGAAAGFMPFVNRVLLGERVQYQRLLTNPYGEQGWRTICLTPTHNATGGIDGFITSALDVHELQVTMDALRTANQRLSSHMDNSPLAVLELDYRLRLTHCSQRAVELMGWGDGRPYLGEFLLQLIGAGDDGLRLALARLGTGHEPQNRVATSFCRADGAEVHMEWFNSALTDDQGRVTSIMALVEDVSAKVQVARQHQHLAHHDSLTGLYNRAAFHEHLEGLLGQPRLAGAALALMFIDLDGFKQVNDELGHATGDEVLRVVAQRLVRAVREGDTVARLGGDEFLVMLHQEVSPEVPGVIGQRILEAVSRPMTVHGHSVQVAASIGVAVHPPVAATIDVLMHSADQAMYAAKRDGKGRLCFATD